MQIVAFKMQLKPGCWEEYKKRHDEIWPELSDLLKHCGLSEYRIFGDKETDALFAVQQQSDGFDETALAKHPIMKKWWRYMADIMETNPDKSPVVHPLEEVFYLGR